MPQPPKPAFRDPKKQPTKALSRNNQASKESEQKRKIIAIGAGAAVLFGLILIGVAVFMLPGNGAGQSPAPETDVQPSATLAENASAQPPPAPVEEQAPEDPAPAPDTSPEPTPAAAAAPPDASLFDGVDVAPLDDFNAANFGGVTVEGDTTTITFDGMPAVSIDHGAIVTGDYQVWSQLPNGTIRQLKIIEPIWQPEVRAITPRNFGDALVVARRDGAPFDLIQLSVGPVRFGDPASSTTAIISGWRNEEQIHTQELNSNTEHDFRNEAFEWPDIDRFEIFFDVGDRRDFLIDDIVVRSRN